MNEFITGMGMPNMNGKLRQLLTTLLAKTEGSVIRWTEVDDGTYRTEVGGGLVRLSKEIVEQEGKSAATAYVVTISDAFGRVVEEYKQRLSGIFGLLGGADSQLLERLYSASRRSALNSDGILEQMLMSLNANN